MRPAAASTDAMRWSDAARRPVTPGLGGRGSSASTARAASWCASATAASIAPEVRTTAAARSQAPLSIGLVEHGPQLVAARSGEGVEDRQRVHALGQVVAGRLAHVVVVGDEVEDVVDHLEGHAVEASERR